jgi:hypothetical protein
MKPTVYHHFHMVKQFKNGNKKQDLLIRSTVCGVIYTDNQNVKHLKIGIASCSPKDSFCKKTGRSVSRLNACQNPIEVIELQNEKTAKKEMIAFISSKFNTTI